DCAKTVVGARCCGNRYRVVFFALPKCNADVHRAATLSYLLAFARTIFGKEGALPGNNKNRQGFRRERNQSSIDSLLWRWSSSACSHSQHKPKPSRSRASKS